jgi:hypothetical protein
MVKRNEEITKAESTEIAPRPDFIPMDRTGTEHIKNEDMQIPRILLAQKTSPEIDPTQPARYIEGLKFCDMFNGLTREIYGRGPLKFAILRADPPRFVEFGPLDQGGGVKDPNVPSDDPRAQFGKDGSKPIATKFYDFIIMLLPFQANAMERMVALSFKSTGLRMAKQLNSLAKLRNAPIYAGVYSLTSMDTKNQFGTFGIYHIANAGWVDTQETYQALETMSKAIANKTVIIDREPGDEEFPPAADEPAATGNVRGM